MKPVACPACRAAGSKPTKDEPKPDGRIKVVTVRRRGRSVPVPAAWVVCQRRVIYYATGGRRQDRVVCGWGWWTTRKDLVAIARRHPKRRLLRRYQQPPGKRWGGGKDTGAEW